MMKGVESNDFWILSMMRSRLGDFFRNWGNKISRWRRKKEYERKIKNGWQGVRIVSEGDSWFQYPFCLKDIIDQLSKHYAILSLGTSDDKLLEMINQNEIETALRNEDPDILLLSGGGNDLLGKDLCGNRRLQSMVHCFSAGRSPEDYPNKTFDALLETVSDIYRKLFTKVLKGFPNIKILCHGYDLPRPTPNKGPWIGKPLYNVGIKEEQLQRRIIEIIMNRFNENLKDIADEFPDAVYFVDCRRAIKDDQWHNEMHPNNDGFASVACRFRSVIEKVTSRCGV